MSALQEHLSEDAPAGSDAGAAPDDSCDEAAPTADAEPSGSSGDTLVLPAIGDMPAPAAKAIIYDGKLDLWLLDEGNSDEVRDMCLRLGVRHFSRKGRGHLELDTGTFANKTKHGNHNRWLWEHAGDYDVVMFVDTDHVPLPIMAERLLGYFRDPDVAFVVGPQFYGNQENRITRWAESAQYLFHSVIQRAGNRRRCAMLVGTNAAVRTSAIKKGYVDSITEDMATSLRIHATRKKETGRPWRSVYTPDLVAVGEGPSSWTEFFGQQARWSAGTFDAILRQVWRVGFKLRPGAMLHYFLMLTYYPSVAIGWIMGIFISACYLGFGISSLRTNAGWWLTYYVDVAAMQFLLYRFMRRHNVSPHERAGVLGAFRNAGLGAYRADIRPELDQGSVAAQAFLQRHGKGLLVEPGPPVDVPLFADVGGRAHRHPYCGGNSPPALSHDDGLDRGHPDGLPRSHRDLALRPGPHRAGAGAFRPAGPAAQLPRIAAEPAARRDQGDR
jgi:hypothetical protein